MQQSLLSVGIDLGTTTTQVIFSRIYLKNTALTAIPNVKITKKEVLYRSKIYFTPVINKNEIDLEALKVILQKEYHDANIQKNDISTGAVIITGETARKENAEAVLHTLSEFAGDFVVATAGPDLESVLAGYGAGAADISKDTDVSILNCDIGGGTTNSALFKNNTIEETFALDIGGRLVRLDTQGNIIYISERILPLIQEKNFNIKLNQKANLGELTKLTDSFALVLLKICQNKPLSFCEQKLFIGNNTSEKKYIPAHHIMFSGGVAEFIYQSLNINALSDISQFGDIGPLLGQSIRKIFKVDATDYVLASKEKIRATVIGAGNHSLHISGSTVVIDEDAIPLKNLPVLYLNDTEIDTMEKELIKKIALFPSQIPAIAFKGKNSPSYSDVKQLANAILNGLKNYHEKILVILVETDFAKALGLTLKRLAPDLKIICLDSIHTNDGDYIDIGKPIGSVVPVVVKTLIFKE